MSRVRSITASAVIDTGSWDNDSRRLPRDRRPPPEERDGDLERLIFSALWSHCRIPRVNLPDASLPHQYSSVQTSNERVRLELLAPRPPQAFGQWFHVYLIKSRFDR